MNKSYNKGKKENKICIFIKTKIAHTRKGEKTLERRRKQKVKHYACYVKCEKG